MRIIVRTTLLELAKPWTPAREEVRRWCALVERLSWRTPADVRAFDPRASILANRRVVFDFSNNDPRLVVKVDYQFGMVFIRWFGTHRDYDRINASEV